MAKLTPEQFGAGLTKVPEVEPDEIDLQMIQEANEEPKDSPVVSWDDYKAEREERTYNGKIALRIPKTLHQDLIEAAKEEGVSLNQYCLYKLAQ